MTTNPNDPAKPKWNLPLRIEPPMDEDDSGEYLVFDAKGAFICKSYYRPTLDAIVSAINALPQ
jgi:hypothetical protein